MTFAKLLQRSFLLGLLVSSPLLVGAQGGGCTSDDDVPIGAHDGGGSVPCGPNSCTGGQECCNESCGICVDPGGVCTQQVCAHDGGKGGVACGKNTCGAGEYCCNSTCGTCAKAGEGCTTIACVEPCDAQDAQGEGACEMFMGYAWNGKSCEGLSGCSCKGKDCGSLYQNQNDCDNAHSHCGGSTGPACGEVTCGVGQECCNASCGICVEPGGACIQVECAPACVAQDAKGDGLCFGALGYGWNGQSCELLGGCSCIGDDCDKIFKTTEECNKAYAGCP